jgi:hypothetical protein
MKNFVLLALFFLTINAYGQEFFETLSPTQRQSLVESYRAVGEQFLKLGNRARGNEYLRIADRIEKFNNSRTETPSTSTEQPPVPDLAPAEPTPPLVDSWPTEESTMDRSTEEETESINPSPDFAWMNEPYPAQPVPYPDNRIVTIPLDTDWPPLPIDANLMACYEQLNRFLTALINEDTNLILNVTSDKFALPGYEKGLNKEQQAQFFNELFAMFQFDALNIDQIYDLESRNNTLFNEFQAVITLNSRPRAPRALADWQYWDNFWGSTHYFFFEKIGDEWKIIAFIIAYEG